MQYTMFQTTAFLLDCEFSTCTVVASMSVLLVAVSAKALEYTEPKILFRCLTLLRPLAKRKMPLLSIVCWNSYYLTDDSHVAQDMIGSTDAPVPLSRDEVDAIYNMYTHLEIPTFDGKIPDLYKVCETFEILRCGQYRAAWLQGAPGFNKLRLWGKHDSSLCITSGTWDDQDDGSDHRGPFIIAFNARKDRGLGIWTGKSLVHVGQLRTFPWIWDRVSPPSHQ